MNERPCYEKTVHPRPSVYPCKPLHAVAGAETGLQWLPLRVPGNVRLILTATHPDPNYLQLHEQKIRQHMMMNPHQGLTSQSSRASSCGDGGETNATTQVDCMDAKVRDNMDTRGDGEAEYESSHRRRKVRRPVQIGRKIDSFNTNFSRQY